MRCQACGSQTTHPPPDAAELDRAYSGHYRPEAGRFSGVGDQMLRRTRATLAGRVDSIAPAGPVLDVGSGDGALLAALHSQGRIASGTERGHEDGAGVPSDGWAAIVLWHSLEHLPRAGERIRELIEDLRPGGYVVIAMPNIESLQARAFGDRWLHLDLPRHLVHVPASALIDRLGDAGLRIERVSYLRGGQIVFGWLHGLVGMLPRHPDLYDAIRRPEARSRPQRPHTRVLALLAGALLLPVALCLTAAEVIARRGGTVYVEARHG